MIENSEQTLRGYPVQRKPSGRTPWIPRITTNDWRKAQVEDKVLSQVMQLMKTHDRKPNGKKSLIKPCSKELLGSTGQVETKRWNVTEEMGSQSLVITLHGRSLYLKA